jgi:septum formation protein
MEVYERLNQLNDKDPADLIISGRSNYAASQISLMVIADTVVIFPPEKDTAEGGEAHGETSEILEKPLSRDDQVPYT